MAKRLMQYLFWISSILSIMYLFRRWIVAKLLRIPSPTHHLNVTRRIEITMSDGAVLVADHYSPSGWDKHPTILIRSPYGRRTKDSGFGMFLEFCGQRFAERGYNVIIQDVRGRFDSSGEFEPFLNEHDDGLETIAWIEQQSWFNGSIGLWGGSYLGLVQWVVASDAPSVKALVPSITGSNLHRILYPDGALDLGLAMRWIKIFQLLDKYRSYPLLASVFLLRQVESAVTSSFDHLSVRVADQVTTGHTVQFYQMWLENADANTPLWKEAKSYFDVKNVSTPVYLIGGWYDFFLRALLEDYESLRQSGQNPYMTIGPWHHFSAITSLIELKEGLIWFDAKLKGNHDRLRKKPVKIFVMGVDKWIELDTWPPPSVETYYYLQSGQRLALLPSPVPAVSIYFYDPLDPTPALGGTQFGSQGGAYDNQSLEARSDVLTFTTIPLEEDVEIIGPVRLVLYVKSSAECADFFGRLCDVKPNGQSINVCDGLSRISFATTTQQEADSLCIEIDMWATAYQFSKGHRIRLQISSGAHPRWNRNSGIINHTDEEAIMVCAEQTIYHDSKHPSALILPLIS